MEVQPYGIQVALVEPGDFCTSFTANQRKTRVVQGETVYTERFARALGVVEVDEAHGSRSEQIGYLLERIITSRSLDPRYMVGSMPEKLAAVVVTFSTTLLPHTHTTTAC